MARDRRQAPRRAPALGSMKTGQHGGVTTVCLHPSARLHRNQRRQLLHRRQMFLCRRQQVLGEALDQGILTSLGFLLDGPINRDVVYVPA